MSKTYETTEYAAMLSRMIRGLGRRIAAGDPSDLAAAVRLQAELDTVIRESVAQMREESGFSWAMLADELGVTRQAAFQRYGRPRSIAHVVTDPACANYAGDGTSRPDLAARGIVCHLCAPAPQERP